MNLHLPVKGLEREPLRFKSRALVSSDGAVFVWQAVATQENKQNRSTSPDRQRPLWTISTLSAARKPCRRNV